MRSVCPLTGMIRAEHSERFDQEFARAALYFLFRCLDAEGTPEKPIRASFLLRSGRLASALALAASAFAFCASALALAASALAVSARARAAAACACSLVLAGFCFFCSGD